MPITPATSAPNMVVGANLASCGLTRPGSSSWRRFKSGCARLSRTMVGAADVFTDVDWKHVKHIPVVYIIPT